MPFTKAYSGLTDAEFREITAWVRKNTPRTLRPGARGALPTPRSMSSRSIFEGIQGQPPPQVRRRAALSAAWRGGVGDKPVGEIDNSRPSPEDAGRLRLDQSGSEGQAPSEPVSRSPDTPPVAGPARIETGARVPEGPALCLNRPRPTLYLCSDTAKKDTPCAAPPSPSSMPTSSGGKDSPPPRMGPHRPLCRTRRARGQARPRLARGRRFAVAADYEGKLAGLDAKGLLDCVLRYEKIDIVAGRLMSLRGPALLPADDRRGPARSSWATCRTRSRPKHTPLVFSPSRSTG